MNIFKMLILKIKNKNIHNWHITVYIVYYIREISKLSLINTHKTILIHDVCLVTLNLGLPMYIDIE